MMMGTNLITTIIGFGLSTAFIVFVCLRLVCSRVRSTEARAAAGVRVPTAFDLELQSEPDQSLHHADDGLGVFDFAMLPTIKYSRGSLSSNKDTQCSICLGEYQEKEILRLVPICGHYFHISCVDEWLTRQLTCPICRLPIHDLLQEKYISASLSSETLQTGGNLVLLRTSNPAEGRDHVVDGNTQPLETIREHMIMQEQSTHSIARCN